MTMIEIGSYIGESTTFFAKHFGQAISIDPYEDDSEETDLEISYFKRDIDKYSWDYHPGPYCIFK